MAKSRSVNLNPYCKEPWHRLINKKFAAVYIALALVLVINQAVFSIVLQDRDKAKAYNSYDTISAQAITDFDNQPRETQVNDLVDSLAGDQIEDNLVLPDGINVGEVVKTDTASAIYYIGADKRKHAFINEIVYFSWFADFQNIKTISAEFLDQIPAGQDVYLRPGTYLIKKINESKIFAILPGGVIKSIKNENIAIALYGRHWKQRVLVLPAEQLELYPILDQDIDSAQHPDGSLISYPNSNAVYYIEGNLKRFVSSDIWSLNNFQDRFIAKDLSPDIIYIDGPDMAEKFMDFTVD